MPEDIQPQIDDDTNLEDIQPQIDDDTNLEENTDTKPVFDEAAIEAILNEKTDVSSLLEEFGVSPQTKDEAVFDYFADALQNPMTKLFAEIKHLKSVAYKNSRAYGSIAVFDHQTKRLARVIHNITISKNINLKPLTFSYLLKDYSLFMSAMVEDIRTYDFNKEVNINLSCNYEGESCILDFSLARYVIMNLISNAICFSSDKADINIDVTTDFETITTTVSDKSGGIADVDIPHIFEEGYIGCASMFNKSNYGMGLGLFNAKNCAIQMRGDLTYEKVPGGSVFTFTLPFSTNRLENDYKTTTFYNDGINNATDVHLAEVIKIVKPETPGDKGKDKIKK
ncbi:MAG: HAMP domain-containing sensor histidine kinase [Clostridia bacterium]